MRRPMLLLAVLLGAPFARAQETWHGGFHLSDLDESVLGLTSFVDAAGERLVALGAFQSAGPEVVGHVAAWDGARWSALGAGLGPAYGAAFCATQFDLGGGPALYVGGTFESAGDGAASNVARWDGTAWSPLGAGTSHLVRTLVGHDDGNGPALYAGGNFVAAGGAPASRIARWDGVGWSALGAGVDGEVLALASFDDGSGAELYAGGHFAHAGGMSAPGIARWDGAAWSPLAPGLECSIDALAVHDDGLGPALFAAGSFAAPLGPARRGIARWKGGAWNFAAELSHAASSYALASHDGGPGVGSVLYLAGPNWDGGALWKANAGALHYIAGSVPFDPSSLHALASVDLGAGPRLVAGGWFSGVKPGGPSVAVPAMNVAAWDGAAWERLGSGGQGLNGGISAFATLSARDGAPQRVAALGDFTLAGERFFPGAALWDGAAWSALADGRTEMRALIEDPHAPGAAFYAGLQSRVAHWDGGAWTRLEGLSGSVEAFAFVEGAMGPELVAAGNVKVDGAPPGQALARWDGATWRTLGLMGTARAIRSHVPTAGAAPELVVAGSFTAPLAGAGVARLHDGVWSWVGGAPVQGLPLALAVLPGASRSDLVVGGSFSAVAGIAARSIARWDGAAWSPLAGGVAGEVFALAVRDTGAGAELVVGGQFELASGVRVGNVARWDGVAWSTLGSAANPGTNGSVRALAAVGPTVYVGGAFTQAGGRPSARMAGWGP